MCVTKIYSMREYNCQRIIKEKSKKANMSKTIFLAQNTKISVCPICCGQFWHSPKGVKFTLALVHYLWKAQKHQEKGKCRL